MLLLVVAVLLVFLLAFVIAVVLHNERMKVFKQKVKQLPKTDDLLKDGFRYCPWPPSPNILSRPRSFSQKKIENAGKFDCIIIGSGLGGLTTGALLSRIGKRVLILEQHDIIGGCTHTFVEKGFEFDTGVHYLGYDATHSKSTLGFIFHLLGMGKIQWSKMDPTFDRAAISPLLNQQLPADHSPSRVKTVNFTDNLNETIRQIKDLFPEEVDAIDHYFRLVQWGQIAFPLYMMLRMMPQWISSIGKRILKPFLSTFFESTTRQVPPLLF
jgi:all-trans-retinol 13,14-reductase